MAIRKFTSRGRILPDRNLAERHTKNVRKPQVICQTPELRGLLRLPMKLQVNNSSSKQMSPWNDRESSNPNDWQDIDYFNREGSAESNPQKFPNKLDSNITQRVGVIARNSTSKIYFDTNQTDSREIANLKERPRSVINGTIDV